MASGMGGHFVDPHVATSACHEVMAKGRSDAVVVGLSAAALWGMPLAPRDAMGIAHGSVSVSRRSRDRAWRGHGVDGHSIELPDEHLTDRGSLVVTTPARTWLDCAALVAADHLLAMGDWSLDRGILDIEELQSVVTWGHGRRGVVLAREVAPLLRCGVESLLTISEK